MFRYKRITLFKISNCGSGGVHLMGFDCSGMLGTLSDYFDCSAIVGLHKREITYLQIPQCNCS